MDVLICLDESQLAAWFGGDFWGDEAEIDGACWDEVGDTLELACLLGSGCITDAKLNPSLRLI